MASPRTGRAPGADAAIEAAVTEVVAEYPEAVVREANAGLG